MTHYSFFPSLLLFITAVILAASCNVSTVEAEARMPVKLEGKWICIGDSITQGEGASKPDKCYVELLNTLAARAKKPLKVMNQGISGWSTQSFVDNSDMVIAKIPEDANLITIMLGTNDAHENGTVEKIARRASMNMEKLIGLYQTKAPQAQLILLAPPAVYPKRLSPRLLAANYDGATPGKLTAITAAYKSLAARLHIRFIDLSTLPHAENSLDGVHPNDAGHEEFAKALWKEMNARGRP